MTILTKDKMLEAAVRLFQTQGYDGTSVRDIAAEADVNIALISYHFGGKQGLYEKIITQFLEGFIKMSREVREKKYSDMKSRLLAMIKAFLIYQSTNHSVARMVHREMTFDSVVVRELMTTYGRMEKYDYEEIIRTGMEVGEFREQPLNYTVIHLRTMVITPFLAPHYLRELYGLVPSEPYFVRKYMEHIEDWVQAWLCQKEYTDTMRTMNPVSI